MPYTKIAANSIKQDTHTGRKLHGPEKAAILFLCLGEARGSELMKQLDDNDIQKITRAVSGLGVIPAPWVEEVITEFSETVATGAGVVGSLAIAENMLRSFLPPEQVNSILKDIRGPLQERDLWTKLGTMNEAVIGEYLNGEHEQTAAVILSRLPTEIAARSLAQMPFERMHTVVERMIRMKAVPAEAMRHIEESLQRDLISNATQQGSSEMQRHMADLFNKLDRDTFEALSQKLEQRMPEDFGTIRQKMFTFDDLLRLDLQSLARVMRALQGNVLPMALRGASTEMREHFFAALPIRSRDMLLDEMNTMGPVRGREVRAAQSAIVECARTLVAQEVIRMPSAEDEEELIE